MQLFRHRSLRKGRAAGANPAVWALFAACLMLLWQSATVWANYGGNWTALFCTGGLQRVPAEVLAEPIYIFQGTYGYDGQCYHYIAHDPFQRRGLSQYVDEPGLRYRRILVPLLAWLLAAGQDKFIDAGFYIVILATVFFGTYWLSTFAQTRDRNSAWGLLFLATPAAILSADRMLVDSALAALTVAFLIFVERPFSWRLWLILAAAALTRETGVLLAIAYSAFEAFRYRWRNVALAASAMVPCAAWYLFVNLNLRHFVYHPSHIPFSSLIHGALQPFAYRAAAPFAAVIQAADLAAAAGAILAVAACIARWRSEFKTHGGFAAILFVLLGAVIQPDDVWIHAGRVLSPLLIILITQWMRTNRVLLLAPVPLMLPRGLVHLSSQLYGILRALGV